MRLGIIGCGAIGTDVAKAADAMTDVEKIYLFDIKSAAAKHLCSVVKKASIKPVEDFIRDVDLVFEASAVCLMMHFVKNSLTSHGNTIGKSIFPPVRSAVSMVSWQLALKNLIA